MVAGQTGLVSFPEIAVAVAKCTNLRGCDPSRDRLMIAECRLLIVEVGNFPSQINNRRSSIVIQFGQPVLRNSSTKLP
jgi:hypothetical protein